jgi:2-phospho-L-lactate guanylyltransferase
VDGDDPGGLNSALARAQSVAADGGAARLLIVPADLPLLRPADVAALLGASSVLSSREGAVIAPDAAGAGTNALVLAPPDALLPRFGIDSYRAHVSQAEARRVPCATVRRPGLELDLDTPADMARLLASGATGRTLTLARSLRLGERLAVVAAT